MVPEVYRAAKNSNIIYYACRVTTLGHMIMAATEKGICSIQFADNKSELTSLLAKDFPDAELVLSCAQDAPGLDDSIAAFDKHLSQGAPRPDLPLDMRGSAFQIKVWQFLLRINAGNVMSYSEVAEKIGAPKAARAVGSACARNPISILIPCHRVLRQDGALGGYKWGLQRKQKLLDKEKQV